jgi:hypothetical protein
MAYPITGCLSVFWYAGLAEAFPQGARFWAGSKGARRAEAAWQAHRVTLLLDYKRKRRDSVRHVPKRQRR